MKEGKLTKAQTLALEHLARPGIVCGGCHSATAKVLLRKGFIERYQHTKFADWWTITDAGRAALSNATQRGE